MTAVIDPPGAAPVVLDRQTWRGRALVPVLIYIGLLVAVVSSLGSPLIPTIGQDYHVSLGTAQWSLTITLLVGAISAPVLGRLGDGPRRRRVLLCALVVLILGSVLAALPVTVFALLLTGRAMQGVGLALLPLVMSVARDHLEPNRSRSTLATLSVTAVVGVGLGYPLTGLISEHLSFHAGFWMAAVLGLSAFVLAVLVVPKHAVTSNRHFDLPGAVFLALGLGLLLISISEGEEWGWLSVRLVAVAVAAVVVLATWVWQQLRITDPLVDLRQLRHRTVLTADVTGILAGIGMYMLMSMIVRYVQTPTSVSYGLGASVVVAGLLLLPLSAASFLASKVAAHLITRISPARMLPVGAMLFVVSLVLFATWRGQLWQIGIEMAIAGAAVGCSFAVMPRMIVVSVLQEETSSALALNQVLRTVGYSIGSALAGTTLTAHTTGGSEFPSDRGYTVGALIAIALCLLTAVASILLPSREQGRTFPRPGDEELIEENVDAALAGLTAYEPEPDRIDDGSDARGARR